MLLFTAVVAINRAGGLSRVDWKGRPSTFLLWVAAFSVVQALTIAAFGLLPHDVETVMKRKALGLILTLSVVPLAAASFRSREIRWGLILFAVCEMVLVCMARAKELEFNNNNLGMRIIVAGLVLFLLVRPAWLGWLALGGGMFFACTLQCRTAVVAATLTLAAIHYERLTRRSRAGAVLVTLIGAVVLFLLLPVIRDVLQTLAFSYLGSQNPIAEFFLSDKDAGKIRSDYFDRSLVWEHMFERSQEHLLLGHGVGTEQAIVGMRSHNAYLSLIFEGGLTLLVAWGAFYVVAGTAMIRRITDIGSRAVRNDPEVLTRCGLALLVYMLLAGLLETSGLGSISSPVNTIFMILAVRLTVYEPPETPSEVQRFEPGPVL